MKLDEMEHNDYVARLYHITENATAQTWKATYDHLRYLYTLRGEPTATQFIEDFEQELSDRVDSQFNPTEPSGGKQI